MSSENLSKRQTEEQKRAEQAWKDVKSVSDSPHDDGFKNSYRDLARKTPASIQSNGLGQALAFLRAKAGKDHKDNDENWVLYRHISAWVMGKIGQPTDKAELLLEWAIQQDSSKYRRAMTEAMAYLNWVKRFAEAMLPEK